MVSPFVGNAIASRRRRKRVFNEDLFVGIQ